MGPGAHNSREGEFGEELDAAQKLVEEMNEATIAMGAKATRQRRLNRVVERSVVGQQSALGASTSIRDQLVRDSITPFTENANPFTARDSNTAEATTPERASRTLADRNPVTPSPPKTGQGQRKQAPTRTQPTYASTDSGRGPDTPIEIIEGAVEAATRTIAGNVARSMQSARRANPSLTGPSNASNVTQQFVQEGVVSQIATYMEPVVDLIGQSVSHRQIDSIRSIHELITNQYDRRIERMTGQPDHDLIVRSRDDYEDRSHSRFINISERLQETMVARMGMNETTTANEETKANDDEGSTHSTDSNVDEMEEFVNVGLNINRRQG